MAYSNPPRKSKFDLLQSDSSPIEIVVLFETIQTATFIIIRILTEIPNFRIWKPVDREDGDVHRKVKKQSKR